MDDMLESTFQILGIFNRVITKEAANRLVTAYGEGTVKRIYNDWIRRIRVRWIDENSLGAGILLFLYYVD